MQLYFIQARVSIKVYGISGPFVETVTQLVSAQSTPDAKTKYEKHIKKRFAHMQAESFLFEYLIVADTI